MENYNLKNPTRSYIWSVKSEGSITKIMITSNRTPKDFWHQVGQFIDGKIIEMKLIGYKITKDYFGNDKEDVFINSNKFMKQSLVDSHNESK